MTATGTAIRKAKQEATEAVENPWVERLIRFGYIMRGALYLIIGLIAVSVVIGLRSTPKDPTGAFGELNNQPYGKILLLLMVVGLAGYSLWGLIRAIWDPQHRGRDKKGLVERLGFLWSSIAYGSLILPALQLSIGVGGGTGNQTAKTQDVTALLLRAPFGVWVVALVGLIVLISGLWQIRYGLTADFKKDLKPRGLSGQQRRLAVRLGQFGYAARGVVFALVGVFLIQAALTFDPQKAQGLDGALLKVAQQPYGPFVLALVALGLVAFGIYSLVSAFWNMVI